MARLCYDVYSTEVQLAQKSVVEAEKDRVEGRRFYDVREEGQAQERTICTHRTHPIHPRIRTYKT